MYRALIVDDEWHARTALRKALAGRNDVVVVGEADSVEEAEAQIEATEPDVIFLDVRLVGKDGFELFARRPIRAQVVFVTAYGEFAVRAFEVQALDYLLKPILRSQVDRALVRLRQVRAPTLGAQAEADALSWDDVICLQDPRRKLFVRVANIAYIEAAAEYTIVHLSDGSESMVLERLRRWESRLPKGFVRIHRATLVNLRDVEEFAMADGGWQIRLRGVRHPLSVSRRCAPTVKSRLQALRF